MGTEAGLRQLFERQVARGVFPGGQLVVRRRGEVLCDFAVGIARREGGVPVTRATRFAVFSASKPVAAIAMAMLEERGALKLDDPVARWFPEFAANGKGELTVLDVLTHRACVFTPDLLAHPERWGDDAAVRQALIEAVPRYPRGTLAYMPYEFGWILAEVVRGVTGRSLRDFVRDEIATPAGIPGLRYGATAEELDGLALTYWLGTQKVYVAGHELSQTFEHDNNLPAVLTAFVPGAGLVCTANDLAAFYDALLSGKLIRPETLERWNTPPRTAFDRSNRLPLRVGRGVLFGNLTPSIYGWWGTQRVFGHAGAFSALAYADPDHQLAVGIVTNGNRGPYESLLRFAPLGSAIRRAFGIRAR
ncbi:MAG: serine hydrolase domain-containing protein [Myxococcaceae bacterium]